MQYISTRGGTKPASFAQVLLEGLAPDGGLYVPDHWPGFSASEIKTLARLSYAEVAAHVLKRFTGEDFDLETLLKLTREAYQDFNHPAVTPLVQMDVNLWLLDLHRGPTLAFKDIAMQILARLYDQVLAKWGKRLTIVVATSGDTGGAAVRAFAGSRFVRLVVLFPKGRVSDVQRRFMTTAPEANIACVAIDGDFDVCQAIVKNLFQDQAFRDEVSLSGVNSINWARIAAQSVYYITSGLALGAPEQGVSFSVPTGNFGDAFAGYVASRIGLPIKQIMIATNENDVLVQALHKGLYQRKGEAFPTMSPAMDIQVASNFERLYFEASGRDASMTKAAFEGFSKTGSLVLAPEILDWMRRRFLAEKVSETETQDTIRDIWRKTRVLIDPHTAVGVKALAHFRAESWPAPWVVLSTASPAKFPESRPESVPSGVLDHPGVAALNHLEERIENLNAEEAAVKGFIRNFVGSGD